MARKRHRKPGDLSQLRAVLWRTILEVEALLDARPPATELVIKSAHALAQLAGSYTRLVETADLEARLQALEAAMQEGKEAR
jgi:ATP:corrinoid adenosyltransferase